jgi:hypothetical protein
MSQMGSGSLEPIDPAASSAMGTEGAPEIGTSDLIVDAAPAVAYPDRPWVMIAGVVGALALGTIVFTTMVSRKNELELGI